MEIRLMTMRNALKAARELNKKGVPKVWMKYIQCGWEIHKDSCACGGNWAWMRPRPSGAMQMYGCVCHNELDERKILDTKENSFSNLVRKAIKKVNPSADDVGKIFYTYPGAEEGTIISRQEFVKLDPVNVGWWTEISELDVVVV